MDSKLDQLKLEADAMGIKYSNNIGESALAAKIEAFKEANGYMPEPQEEEVADEASKDIAEKSEKSVETRAQKLNRIKKEATKLVRCTVTAMNPAHRDYQSDVFFFSSQVTGKIGNCIVFGVPWHVPQCIVDFINTKTYSHVETDKNGEFVKVEMRKAYSVAVLPHLSEDEMADLAKQQAARG